jgi:hypothetical protein
MRVFSRSVLGFPASSISDHWRRAISDPSRPL